MRDTVRQRTSRDAILDATDRLLAENGYKKMTIDDLAKDVGIGKGSVYLHFESKEDIALSHIDRIIERLKARLRAVAQNKSSCEKRLRQMLIERVLFRFDSVQHYTRSLNEMLAHLRPRLLERRKKYFDEEARIFAEVIEEGVAAGVFDVKKPLSAATALLDATNSLLPYSLSAIELGHRGEIEKKVSTVADLLLSGMVKR
jgi:AcrR family transcriptional regulator